MLCEINADWKAVKDMYNYSSSHETPLLSNYNGTFWAEYITNYDRYDKMFNRLYSSYRYYHQMPYTNDNEISSVTEDFTDAVYTFLAMNDKRFSELYRLKVLDTSTFNPLMDYNITDTHSETVTHEGSNTYGEREDSTTDTLGSRSDTSVEQIEGFNSVSFQDSNKTTDTIGTQENSSSLTKGEQQDSDEYQDEISKTITRTGNTENPYDNIIKFQKAWTDFDFMGYIFKEICKEFLLV